MTQKILIIGGGVAGTIVANGLCRQIGPELGTGAVQITMLSASDKHMYQPGLLYVPFGKILRIWSSTGISARSSTSASRFSSIRPSISTSRPRA